MKKKELTILAMLWIVFLVVIFLCVFGVKIKTPILVIMFVYNCLRSILVFNSDLD